MAIANILKYTPSQTAGIVLLGSVSGGQASNLFTLLARGDVALSVVCTVSFIKRFHCYYSLLIAGEILDLPLHFKLVTPSDMNMVRTNILPSLKFIRTADDDLIGCLGDSNIDQLATAMYRRSGWNGCPPIGS